MNKLTLETLERWLWDSADLMRGHIDSSDFKNYIFGLLFLKRANDQFLEESQQALNLNRNNRKTVVMTKVQTTFL